MLPLQDVDHASLAEARSHRRAMGAVSYYVRPNPIQRPGNLNHIRITGRCGARSKSSSSDLDSRLGLRHGFPSFGDRMDTHRTWGYILAYPFEVMCCDGVPDWCGVFETLPKVKRRSRRGRCRMDAVLAATDGTALGVQRQRRASRLLEEMRPTEYFKRNVFVACRSDEPTLKAALDIRRRRQLRLEHGLPASRRHLAGASLRKNEDSLSPTRASARFCGTILCARSG